MQENFTEEDFNNDKLQKYEDNYSEDKLMDKLSRFAGKLGISVVYKVLLLFYVMKSPDVPIKEKALIIGALGYLILPVDLIPDAIPLLGFTDDLAALAFVVNQVRCYITENVQQMAQEKLSDWFDSFTEDDLLF